MPDFTFVLEPPPGINSDDTSFSAKGRWADASNVRPYNGGMQVIGDYTFVYTLTAGQTITGMAAAQATSGAVYLVAGTFNKLWAGVGVGAPVDVTPLGGIGGITWAFAPYGNTLLCNPSGGTIYQYTPGGTAAEITQAPDRVTRILAPRRQVIAFGCNEEISTTFNPRCIRGSDFEDPTSWTTSSTNNAFEDILDDAGGIVDAKEVGDYIAVWTTTSLWFGQFVGEPSQTYRWEKVDGGIGAIGLDPATVMGGTAYWFGTDLQVWAWSPGAPPAPVPCPISKEFIDNLSSPDALRIAAVPHYNEIWVTFTDDRDSSGDPSRYVAFNQKGEWFRGRIDRMLLHVNGLTANEARLQYNDTHAAAAFLAAFGNVVYLHEMTAGNQVGTTTPTWFLQSADQYIEEGRRGVQIQRAVPDFKGQEGDVSLTLNMRDRPQSTPVTKGPYTLTAASTKKDFRAAGMIASVKFSGSAYARLGRVTFDAVTLGAR